MKYLYAIRSDMEYVKFGLSQSPVSRLNELQTGNHGRLCIAALIPCPNGTGHEALVHAVCREEHANGEWFHYHGFVLAAINAMQQDMLNDYNHHLTNLLMCYVPIDLHGRHQDVEAWAMSNRPQRPLRSV